MTEPSKNDVDGVEDVQRTEAEETREKERGKSEEKQAETAGAKAARKEAQSKRKAAKAAQPEPTDDEVAVTAGDGGEEVKTVAKTTSPKVETSDEGFDRETAKVKAAVQSGEGVRVEAPEAGKTAYDK